MLAASEEAQNIAGVMQALQNVQTEQSRLSVVLGQMQVEQQRNSVVMTGMQRDVGDIVTDQAALTLIIRGGGNGDRSLVTRLALAERTIDQSKENLADHRRAVETKMTEHSATLEVIRTSVEHQQREQERQRADSEQQRAQSLIQAITWALSIIALISSVAIALFHH